MVGTNHNFGLQCLNQARIATHARDWLATATVLRSIPPELHKAFHLYGGFFSSSRKAMREMAIVNAAMVLDSRPEATSFLRLLEEIGAEMPSHKPLCDQLALRMKEHLPAFRKASRLRNQIIAHRSRQRTYRQVHEEQSLNDLELTSAIETWLDCAQSASLTLRGERWGAGSTSAADVKRLLHDIVGLQNDQEVQSS